MSDGDDLMTTPQEALRGLLMTPCDCAEDWTARNRHAPDCRFQFIHDFLSDDDIADVLGMNPNPYRTPALAQAAPPSGLREAGERVAAEDERLRADLAAPPSDYVVCDVAGCNFAVERGEGRTMALHRSEDHQP